MSGEVISNLEIYVECLRDNVKEFKELKKPSTNKKQEVNIILSFSVLN
jgi:hypothetical protein